MSSVPSHAALGTHEGYLQGTERARHPSETIEWVRPHLPSMGITRIADITGLDRIGIPVVTAIRPNSRSLAVSQGKGMTLAAATASAVMECIELYHAERPLLPLRMATARELRRVETVADLDRLAGAQDSRYHEDLAMLWAMGEDLMGGPGAWLPFEVIHMNACLPAPSGSGCWQATSNGLASGNTRDEAVVHALCEVIERDAAAVWQVSDVRLRDGSLLDLRTVDHPGCRWMLDRFELAGVSVKAWDITSDAGVATFLAEISEPIDAERSSSFSGMGTHLRREIALSRALSEAAQSRLTYISGSRDDIFEEDYRRTRGPSPAPLEGTAAASRRFDEVSTRSAPATIEEDRQTLLSRLQRIGIDAAYVVDLTDPVLNIPVVRVVVPGLEGPDDDPSYRPGQRARRARRTP